MTLLLMVACELFRGPWGAWVLSGDGDVTSMSQDEVPVVIDSVSGLWNRDRVDALMAEMDPVWLFGVVVEGRGLLVTWDASSQVASFTDLAGNPIHAIADVVLPNLEDVTDRDRIAEKLAVGLDAGGGVVMVHGLDSFPDDPVVRIHRWSGGPWSWTDVTVELAFALTDDSISQLTAWQDQLAWITRDAVDVFFDGETAQFKNGLDQTYSVLFDADGTLNRLGRSGREDIWQLHQDDCVLDLEAGQGRLVPGPNGGVELFFLNEYGTVTRTPVTRNCELGETRVSWTPGYLYRESPPLIWGGDGVFWGVFDVDPFYDHPNPHEYGWESAVYSDEWRLDTGRY
jgi:hypothetical protein